MSENIPKENVPRRSSRIRTKTCDSSRQRPEKDNMESAEHSGNNETTDNAQKTEEVRKGDIEDTISNIPKHSEKQRGSRLSSSNSKIVLPWVKTDTNKLKQFVSNRIQKILEHSNSHDCRWIPSKPNSADRATKKTISEYEKDWFEGPDFLKQLPDSWPQDDGVYDADTREMKKEFISPISVKNNLPLPDVMRFSSWCKLVRCTAKVLKFIRRCQKRDVCIEVSADELRETEKLWWKEVQNHCFPEEPNGIGQNDDLEGSKLKNVSTYPDGEGILRVRSRIS
ncbi:hypothetical protein JTB14_037924 [Gonioctena quinquepunctata]|nr:hypothetical protein JTB14_037924 [Gonioctena quinquepunctata]